MTKNFILIGVIFITGFLIVGCENKEELDYTDFESHFITEASDAFKDTEEIHIEYFYSQYCSHCQDIKQDVLHFLSKLDDTEYYIIDTSKVVNMYLLDEIKGTPTLVLIKEGEIVEEYIGSTEILRFINRD